MVLIICNPSAVACFTLDAAETVDFLKPIQVAMFAGNAYLVFMLYSKRQLKDPTTINIV